ncbi:MAG: hypothetical protein Q8R36_01185 [bacterium]|nr:hypothetical protein [bacterium]
MKFLAKKAYSYWMKGVYILGEINSRVIFAFLFCTIVGVYAVFIKFFSLFKKTPARASYWVKKEYREPTIENLTKQF